MEHKQILYLFLANTGFTSVEHCISYFDSIPNQGICPYPQLSDTRSCRTLHAFSSLFAPQIHCSHVRPVSNFVCKDSCLPACSNCHPDSECVATHPGIPNNFTSILYQCKCKNGYIGNGTSCTPKTCNYGNCPAVWGSFDCSANNNSNLCHCTETFFHNPTDTSNNLCTCPITSRIIYLNSKPVCVPQGRCTEQWHCNKQNFNQVKCLQYGNNSFTLFKSCVCNYGFLGGWEYPCTCPQGNRIVWSEALMGEVCFSPTQCTVNWHCPNSQHCVVDSDQIVGNCVAN